MMEIQIHELCQLVTKLGVFSDLLRSIWFLKHPEEILNGFVISLRQLPQSPFSQSCGFYLRIYCSLIELTLSYIFSHLLSLCFCISTLRSFYQFWTQYSYKTILLASGRFHHLGQGLHGKFKMHRSLSQKLLFRTNTLAPVKKMCAENFTWKDL